MAFPVKLRFSFCKDAFTSRSTLPTSPLTSVKLRFSFCKDAITLGEKIEGMMRLSVESRMRGRRKVRKPPSSLKGAGEEEGSGKPPSSLKGGGVS